MHKGDHFHAPLFCLGDRCHHPELQWERHACCQEYWGAPGWTVHFKGASPAVTEALFRIGEHYPAWKECWIWLSPLPGLLPAWFVYLLDGIADKRHHSHDFLSKRWLRGWNVSLIRLQRHIKKVPERKRDVSLECADQMKMSRHISLLFKLYGKRSRSVCW